MLYTAMFDEINEGTAIFKLAAERDQEPTGTDLFALNADGCHAAGSDMYLRVAGGATRPFRKAPKLVRRLASLRRSWENESGRCSKTVLSPGPIF
jgi:hypothetical protein